MKFAVQAFAALNSNNFVRFFKLVQSASYLNACLLHCYFNQVSGTTASNIGTKAVTVEVLTCFSFPVSSKWAGSSQLMEPVTAQQGISGLTMDDGLP